MGTSLGCLTSTQVFPVNNPLTLEATKVTKVASEVQSKDGVTIPLTEREIFSISKSWKGISRNMAQTGVHMFLR